MERFYNLAARSVRHQKTGIGIPFGIDPWDADISLVSEKKKKTEKTRFQFFTHIVLHSFFLYVLVPNKGRIEINICLISFQKMYAVVNNARALSV